MVAGPEKPACASAAACRPAHAAQPVWKRLVQEPPARNSIEPAAWLPAARGGAPPCRARSRRRGARASRARGGGRRSTPRLRRRAPRRDGRAADRERARGRRAAAIRRASRPPRGRAARRASRRRLARGAHVPLPGGEALLALRRAQARVEQPLAPPARAEIVRPSPHAGREPGQPRRPERARLEDGRALDGEAEGVRLELEEDVVLRRAAVGA